MKNFMNPTRSAVIYSAASVFIGPLVFLLGTGLFTRGGGDYCDLAYHLPDGSFDPKRIVEFKNAQIFQIAGASIMLLLGLFIATYLFAGILKKPSALNISVALAVIFMMLGYVFVILVSGKSGQVC